MPQLLGPDGRPVRVGQRKTGSSDGRLDTSSRSNSRAYYAARDEGRAYSFVNATYNYAAADTILGMKNTSGLDFVPHSLLIGGDTATLVTIHIPTSEVTMAGTPITGRNLNGNFKVDTSLFDAQGEETGNTQGDIIAELLIPAGESVHIGADVFGEAVRLTKNQMIGVDFVTDGGAAHVTMVGYFE